jgi:hypothetical protein
VHEPSRAVSRMDQSARAVGTEIDVELVDYVRQAGSWLTNRGGSEIVEGQPARWPRSTVAREPASRTPTKTAPGESVRGLETRPREQCRARRDQRARRQAARRAATRGPGSCRAQVPATTEPGRRFSSGAAADSERPVDLPKRRCRPRSRSADGSYLNRRSFGGRIDVVPGTASTSGALGADGVGQRGALPANSLTAATAGSPPRAPPPRC